MNNTLRKLLFASFAVLLTLGAASSAFAQSTGSIRGTVSDPSGAAIAKAAFFPDVLRDHDLPFLRHVDNGHGRKLLLATAFRKPPFSL